MTQNYYDENRQKEIMESLYKEKLLTENGLYKSEELPAYQSFADALLRNISVSENYATPFDISDLVSYMQRQSEILGLKDDCNVRYTIEQLEILGKKIYALKKGLDGEQLAKRAMFGIDAPNQILTNIEFDMDDLSFETDAIVINSKGICVIEVKNIHRNLVIDENGTLVAADGSNCTYCNVRTKLNNAVSVIRRILEQSFPDNSKLMKVTEHIHSVLFSADGSIIDSCREIVIADCNNIVRVLNNLQCEETLNREEINTVAEALKSAAQRKQYPMNCDYVRVAKAFATTVAKLEYAIEHDPMNRLLKSLCKQNGAEYTATPNIEELSKEKNSYVFVPKKKKRRRLITTAVAGVAVLSVGLLLNKNKF